MAWNDTLLLDVQQEVYDRLCNDEFFFDVAVLLQRKGDIENDVENALTVLNEKSGKVGACVVVLMPEVEAPENQLNLPGPTIVVVQSINVITNAMFNDDTGGTGKPAEQIALNAINLLHQYGSGKLGEMLSADSKPVRPISARDGEVMYQVVARLPTGLSRTSQVMTPQPTRNEDTGLTEIATGTAGATIYYTTDGSYPGPANVDAVMYVAPFLPPVPSTLRIGAYKAEHIPSDTVEVIVAD